MKLSFVKKIFLLVSLPLVFELLFVGGLAFLLKKVEVEKTGIEQSREILLNSERFYRTSYELAQALLLYQATNSPAILRNCRQRMKLMRTDLKDLDSSMSRNPLYAQQSTKITALTTQLLEAIEVLLVSYSVNRSVVQTKSDDNPTEAFSVTADQLSTTSGLDALLRSNSSFKTPPFNKTILEQIRFESRQLIEELNSLNEQQRKIGREKPQVAEKLRQTLELLFWAGLSCSILLAVALTVAFNRNTTRRLEILVTNTDRLACGQHLLPALGGHDEIATLDEVFHSMARRIDESTQRLRAVIDCIPLALVSVTDEGIIESINPCTSVCFKASSDQLVGRPLDDLFEGCGGSNSNMLMDLIQRAQTASVEKIAKRADETVFPVEISLARYQIGDYTRWLVIMEDVTQIRETQKLKQELTAVVSHELRTPLTSMQVFLSGLGMGTYGELRQGAEKRIAGIQRSVQRLIRLINDLLDSEKIESGQLSINKTVVNLADCMHAAFESVREFAEKDDIELVFEPANVVVLADFDRLVQILVNLLSNAIKFSPAKASVKFIAVCTAETARIEIQDQGPGIEKQYHQVIFEKFHQFRPDAKVGRSDKVKGTGLGLSLTKYLVAKHEGTIGVISEPGAGSTFWVQLPVLEPGDSMAEGSENVAPQRSAPEL